MVSVDSLVDRAISVSSGRKRTLITLAGIPGAGKSTIGLAVAQALNDRGIPTVVVGMDGYHYTRIDLASRIGEEKAVKYRGAPYTFDAAGVVSLAKKLSEPDTEVHFPTFDHALKDPVSDGGYVPASTKIVILEGNYLHLKDPEWDQITKYAADTWFVTVDTEIARERLGRRHVKSGIVTTLEDGYKRADDNDLVNGRYIIEHSKPAAFEIENNA